MVFIDQHDPLLTNVISIYFLSSASLSIQMVQFYGNQGGNAAHESLHVMHGRHLELFYINILMKWKYQRKGSTWPSGRDGLFPSFLPPHSLQQRRRCRSCVEAGGTYKGHADGGESF